LRKKYLLQIKSAPVKRLNLPPKRGQFGPAKTSSSALGIYLNITESFYISSSITQLRLISSMFSYFFIFYLLIFFYSMIYSKSRVKQVSLKSFSLVVVDAKITNNSIC